MSSGARISSWGEGASIALVGHPSSGGITIKIPRGVDVLLHRPASHPHLFLLGWLKLNLTLLLDQLRLAKGHDRWRTLMEIRASDSFLGYPCHL